jgi:hypothetical protein
MSTLTDQAAAAIAAERAAESNARQQAIDALKLEAKNALLAVIAPLTWAQAGLTVSYTNLEDRLAIVGDGTIFLGVRKNNDGTWVVHLVKGSGSNWTRVSEEPLHNLADLGEAIEKAAA